MRIFKPNPVPERQTTSQFLITGLGNPGRQYAANRHNVGFMVLDSLAERLGVSMARMESKALVAKAEYVGNHLILAKPQTYMNLSGQAVRSLARYYKVSLDMLIVVYDDVDLPFGTLRLRPAGGSGGHKGMVSIIDALGTQDFPRLRIGIGRPPGRMDAADYVLRDFNRDETGELPLVCQQSVEALLTYISRGIAAAMNTYNTGLSTDSEE